LIGRSLRRMRWSLHCAADGETVRRFGRDDNSLGACFGVYGRLAGGRPKMAAVRWAESVVLGGTSVSLSPVKWR